VLPLISGLFFLGAYVWNANSNLCLIGAFAETKTASISILHVLNSRESFVHLLFVSFSYSSQFLVRFTRWKAQTRLERNGSFDRTRDVRKRDDQGRRKRSYHSHRDPNPRKLLSIIFSTRDDADHPSIPSSQTSNPGSDDRREMDAQTRSNRHDPDGISLESFEQEDALKRAQEAASDEAYLATLARGPFASEVSFAETARTNESGMNLVPDNRGSSYRE